MLTFCTSPIGQIKKIVWNKKKMGGYQNIFQNLKGLYRLNLIQIDIANRTIYILSLDLVWSNETSYEMRYHIYKFERNRYSDIIFSLLWTKLKFRSDRKWPVDKKCPTPKICVTFICFIAKHNCSKFHKNI